MSRRRVLVRAALLATGGGFMLCRAIDAGRAAAGESGGDALLLRRVALVEGLVAVLALAAAVIALLALRTRPRRRTLRLDTRTEPDRRDGRGPPAPGSKLSNDPEQ